MNRLATLLAVFALAACAASAATQVAAESAEPAAPQDARVRPRGAHLARPYGLTIRSRDMRVSR